VCVGTPNASAGGVRGAGLCFSVLKGVKPPPSLSNMYKELATDIPGFVRPGHGYLESWAEQVRCPPTPPARALWPLWPPPTRVLRWELARKPQYGIVCVGGWWAGVEEARQLPPPPLALAARRGAGRIERRRRGRVSSC
jgi:hypothetical protein